MSLIQLPWHHAAVETREIVQQETDKGFILIHARTSRRASSFPSTITIFYLCHSPSTIIDGLNRIAILSAPGIYNLHFLLKRLKRQLMDTFIGLKGLC